MDGRFSQYCGFISAQSRANKDATDVVESLEEATKGKDRIVTDYCFALTVNISVTDSVTQYLILSLSLYLYLYLTLTLSLLSSLSITSLFVNLSMSYFSLSFTQFLYLFYSLLFLSQVS